MHTSTHYREPVYTIGQLPFAAGTIVLRNHLRRLRQRERIRRRQALREQVRRLIPTFYRFVKAHSAPAEVGHRPAAATA